jgi:hypothetical protein
MSTLKQLVDETTNIKNELKTCYANLKNNLVNKKIQVNNNDKILDLINKIPDIKGELKYAIGSETFGQGNAVVVTVNNLDFKPHLIIITRGTFEDQTYFIQNTSFYFGDIAVPHFPKNHMFSNHYALASNTIDGTMYYMRDGSFNLPYHTGMGAAKDCTWLAVGL